MTSVPVVAKDIKGFMPSVEPTRAEGVFALNGDNYLFDSLGPRSGFGNRLLLPQAFVRPQYSQAIRLKLRGGDRVFTFVADCILEWQESKGGWRVIYTTPDTTLNPYRWTYGYLNGVVYFCHPRTGLLAYVLESDQCFTVDVPGAPTDGIACAVSNGRVGVIGTELLYWSNPSDGLNWVPELGGAGFQRISDRVSGDPIILTDFAAGFLTWTTGGVMQSVFSGDQFVFRHRAVGTEYRPANPFCALKVDNETTAILDERGLFKSRGDALEPMTPLFNEFLIEFIRENRLTVGDNLRLEWDELRRLLYVSVSLTYADPLFERCFVLYPGLDKWGQMSESHYGILPVRIQNSTRSGDYYGFVDSEGRLRYWTDVGSRAASPESDVALRTKNLFYPPMQKPPEAYTAEDDSKGLTLASSMIFNTIPTSQISREAGYYNNGSASPAAPTLVGLGSKIQIGLFNFSSQISSDDLSEIVNVWIRSVTSAEAQRASVDFNLIPANRPPEDYNERTSGEDFGFGAQNYVNHRLRLIGTLDGISELMSAEPTLVEFAQGARYYSCSVTGVWHIVEIAAVDVGESFHVRSFGLTAIPAGRLG